jgi:7-cyano-7-deazaguanine synthase in queuosine biosynthesis
VAKNRALLMLSGGIDSTYCMYQALSQGRPLAVHHIHLVNREGRADAERRAVSQILKWFRRRGLTNFTYTESTFDYGTVNHLVKDYSIYALMIGVLLQDPRNRDISSFIHPRHSDAFNLRKGQTFESVSRRANEVLTGIPKLVARREIKMELPIVHMTKKEVIEACPPSLLRLTWACRRPRRSGSVFLPCNVCFTCRQIQAAGGIKRADKTPPSPPLRPAQGRARIRKPAVARATR